VLQPIPVASLDAPELIPYRTLRRHEAHRRAGIFVAEGDKVVHRAIAAGLKPLSFLLTPERQDEFAAVLHERSENVPGYIALKPVVEELIGFALYQGVLAVFRVPEAPGVDGLLARTPKPRLFAALDELNNAENVGVLIRNAVAFGCQGIVAGPTCSSPWMRRSVRNSMGTIFRVPVLEADDLPAVLTQLRHHGVSVVAAHPHADQTRLSQVDLRGDVCFVFGNEHGGVTPAVLVACSLHAAIPMAAEVDSLNVANASATFFYEAARQRGHV
jgi:tRNA G18 (ribose-2'-O)-methylase SpoU